MTTQTILRGSSRGDLLAIPSIMLGFHPAESVVAMGLNGKRVEFCARLDLDLPDPELTAAVDQVRNARDNKSGTRFILAGYGRDVTRVADAVERLCHRLGDEVVDAVLTDGNRYWDFEDGVMSPFGGIPFEYSASAIAAHAVYAGMSVSDTREDAVAEVLPPPAHALGGIAERVDQAHSRVVGLDADEQLALLGQLIEGTEPLTPDDAAELAVLLQVAEHQAEVLGRLTRACAKEFRLRLIEARATSDPECEPGVLGVLALACWLAGEGAQQNECMNQLAAREPGHAVLQLLERLHQLAVPPSWWDEEA